MRSRAVVTWYDCDQNGEGCDGVLTGRILKTCEISRYSITFVSTNTMANKALFQTARDFVMKAMYGKATPHGRLTSDLKSSLERSVTWQHMQKLSDASRFKAFCGKVNEHLNILAILFARQCNAIAVQKVRRAVQIVSLYHRLGYDRRAIQNVVERLSNSFLRNKKDKSLYFMFGAAMFAWQKEKFSHDDINWWVLLNWHEIVMLAHASIVRNRWHCARHRTCGTYHTVFHSHFLWQGAAFCRSWHFKSRDAGLF